MNTYMILKIFCVIIHTFDMVLVLSAWIPYWILIASKLSLMLLYMYHGVTLLKKFIRISKTLVKMLPQISIELKTLGTYLCKIVVIMMLAAYFMLNNCHFRHFCI